MANLFHAYATFFEVSGSIFIGGGGIIVLGSLFFLALQLWMRCIKKLDGDQSSQGRFDLFPLVFGLLAFVSGSAFLAFSTWLAAHA